MNYLPQKTRFIRAQANEIEVYNYLKSLLTKGNNLLASQPSLWDDDIRELGLNELAETIATYKVYIEDGWTVNVDAPAEMEEYAKELAEAKETIQALVSRINTRLADTGYPVK